MALSQYETSMLDDPLFVSSTESILDALRMQGRGEVKDLSPERIRYLLQGARYEPKKFTTELLTGFVGRRELLDIWQRIENAIKPTSASIPGVYIAGPPGAGKSSSMYFSVLKARRSGYLAVYIAKCDDWCALPPDVAKGFFLDAVHDASEAVKRDGKVPITVPNPPNIADVAFSSWERFADASKSTDEIDRAFDIVHGTMRRLKTPVVLFFDEQNGLYETFVNQKDAYIRASPFNLANFTITYATGCVVISGTTDTEFHDNIKGGHHEHVYTLTCLAEDDFKLWLDDSSQFSGPIAEYYRHNDTEMEDVEDIRNTIGTVTGRIPRELRQYCKCQQDSDASLSLTNLMNALQRRYLDDLTKRMTDTYNRYLNRDKDRARRILDDVLDLCIREKPRVVMEASFRSLGLVYRTDGDTVFLTPTTRGVLLGETVKRLKGDPKSSMNKDIALFLSMLQVEYADGGERGYAFEKLVFLRMMQMGTLTLHWQDLMGVRKTTFMDIREQWSIDVKSPPAHWQHVPEGTLVSHPREGEHRFDFVYYGKGVVTFLELTVSDYATTKVPSMTETGAAHLRSIQEKVRKWIGEHHYTVKVADGKLVAVPILSKKRKKEPVEPDVEPEIPALNYVILTPRALHGFNSARAKKYAFIGVCGKKDLLKSGIVSAEEIRTFKLRGAEGEE